MSITLFAQQEQQSIKEGELILHYNQENQRIPFLLPQDQEPITLCGLEVGAEYNLLATAFNQPNCNFKIKLYDGFIDDESSNPNVVDYSDLMVFTATTSCMQFYILESNCSNLENLSLDLSVMPTYCKPEEDGGIASSVAVLQTDYDYSIEQLITEIFIGGGCFDVENVQLIGNTNGAGHFVNGTTNVGFEEGVILASGNIANAEGPNNVGGAGTSFGDTNNDPDLSLLGAGAVRDAVGIEFDFTPTLDVINFDYVFGSEEYCEWVNSTFNDVFGFFISGPGFNGPFTNGAENIALVPGTGNYVAINSVNHLTNTAYFVPNSAGCGGTTNAAEIQYDGYTTVLTATANVIPCETYHIRMVVSDIGDHILDSGVFLKANSFQAGGQAGVSVNIPSIGSDGIAYEGCSNGELIFERDPDSVLDFDYIVDFTIDPSSTATNGIDYSSIPSPVTIPAGEVSISIPFDVFEDGIPEGIETIIIQLDNPCSCQASSVEIMIDDLIPLEVVLEDVIACGSAEIVLTPSVVGGVPDLLYQWSTGETGTSISVITTMNNSYTVTVSDVCGMSAEATALVEIIPFSTADISGEGFVCSENTMAELEITFTGDGPWEIYYTQNGAPVGPITNITDNPYTLIVDGAGTYELLSLTDASGLCPGAVSGIVTIETLEIELIPDIVDVGCSGNDDGSIFVIADGGTPDYIYDWSNGEGGVFIDQLAPGSYTVTATDANGCTVEETYDVNESPEIIAELVAEGLVNCQSAEGGAIDLTVNGGLPVYDYFWNTGDQTEDIANLPEGTYSVTVFDSNGCTAEATIDIVGNFEEPIAVANVDGLIDCNGGSASLSGSGSSGSGGSVSYAWYLDGALVSTSENFETADIGNYVLVVTDNTNGCTAEASAQVDTNVEEPSPVANVIGDINCINSMATLDATGSSGNGTISYEWYNASGTLVGTGQTLDVATGGGYILIITDASNGCTAETSIDVAEDQTPPVLSIDPPAQLDCITTNVIIDGSGSSGDGSETYQWFYNGTLISEATFTEASEPGTYTLIITNGINGCTAQGTINVSQDITPPPASIEIPDQLTCEELSVFLSTNVSGTFQWQDAGGTILGTDPDLEVMTPGTYTLVVTGQGNGCTAEASVEVTENMLEPTAMTGPDGVLNCGGSTASISGAGSSTGPTITYEWYNESGVLVGTDLEIDVSEIGTYTLIVTDGSNGCTSEATSLVSPDTDLPNIEVVPPIDLTCLNDIATLIGSSSTTGNIEYAWYQGANLVSNDLTVDVSTPGIYTFVVTNTDNGCVSEATVEVVENQDDPISMPEVNGIITCADGIVFLIGDASEPFGLIEYEWLDPSGTIISNEALVEVSEPGEYILIITNTENGCTAEMPAIVEADEDLPSPVAIPDGVISCNEEMVIIDGSGSSGSGAITYEWFSGATVISTNPSVEVDAAGTYTLIITNELNGCTATVDAIVDEDLQEPIAQIDPVALLDCINEIVTINAGGSSGSGDVTLEWLNQAGDPIGTGTTIDVGNTGTYTVIVTNDDNGCTAEASITVEQNDETPIPLAVNDGILTCVNDMVNLTGSASGNGTLVYEWSGPSGPLGNDNPIAVNATGTYTLVVTNSDNGCSETTSVEVNENLDTPTAFTGPDGNLTCTVEEVTLDGTGSTTGANITYEWQNPGGVIVSTDLTADVSEVGTYTLLVTNTESGCTELATVTVIPDLNLPIVEAGLPQVLNCDIDMVTITGTVSGNGPFEYEWLDANNLSLGSDLEQEVTEEGVYTLVVTNSGNGCASSASVQVNLDLLPPPADAGTPQLLTCDINLVTLDGSGSDGLAYEWTDPNGTVIGSDETVDVELPGTYQILVTGANGCTSLATVDVAVDADLPVADPGAEGLLTCVQDMVTLGGVQTTTGPGITYEWLNENNEVVGTDITLDVTTPGTYTLNVYNTTNDCDATGQVEVALNQTYPEVDPGIGGELNCLVTEIMIGGTGTDTGSDIEIIWLDQNGTQVGTDAEIMVGEPGTYTLLVTNTTSSCSASQTVEVTQNNLDPSADAGVDQLLDCGSNSVTLDGTNSNAPAGSIQYEWTSPTGVIISAEATIDVAEAGIYQLLITSENGCTSMAEVEVNLDADVPQPLAVNDGILTCVNEVVNLSGTVVGAGTIVYEWQDENGVLLGSDNPIAISTPGVYTLNVLNQDNGCSGTTTVVVAENLATPTALAGPDDMITCDETVANLDGTGSSIGTDITYEWLSPGGVTVSTEITADVTEIGTYILVVTNQTSGCTQAATVEVTPDANLPIAEAGLPQILDCTIEMVTLSGAGSSTGTNINYEWTDPNGTLISTDLAIDVSDPGTYVLEITNTTNGCTATASVQVDQDLTPPIADAGAPQLIDCDVSVVTLNGSASDGVTFEWLNESGIVISTNETVDVEEEGTYQLLITGANGCTSMAEVDVTIDTNVPLADSGLGGLLTCVEDMVTLGGTNTSTGPGITYEWLDENNVIVGADPTLDVTVPGTYTLNVYNTLNNCESTAQAIVTEDQDYPIADPGITGTLTCDLIEIMLGGTGTSTGPEITYSWLDATGTEVGTELELAVNVADIYTLVVSNTTNDCVSTASIEVDDNLNPPAADAGQNQLLTCDIAAVNLDGSGSIPNSGTLEYEWTNAGGVIVGTTPTVSVEEAGTYQLLVTGDNGCTAIANVDVNVDANVPVADAGLGGQLDCNVDLVTIGGPSTSTGAGIIYEWTNNTGQVVGTTPMLDVTLAGTYTLTVFNQNNNCDISSSVEVMEDLANPVADPGLGGLLTCDVLEINLGTGATTTGPGIEYIWENELGVIVGTDIELDVTASGTYTLYVNNTNNGCSSNQAITIDQDILDPVADAGGPSILTCETTAVILDGSGSSVGSEFTYEWYNSNNVLVSTDMSPSIAEADDYTLIVTNVNNACSATSAVSITPDENLPSALAATPNMLTCAIQEVALDGTASSTTSGQIDYEWQDATQTIIATTSNTMVSEPGIYTLVITDPNNGCTTTTSVEVPQNIEDPTAFAGAPATITCDQTEVSLNGSGTGDALQYEWFNDSNISVGTSPSIEVEIVGTYTLVVTDGINGCTAISTVEVSPDNNIPVAEAGDNGVLTCVVDQIVLNAAGSSTGTGVTYEWLSPSGISLGSDPTITVTETGAYTLIVYDSNNDCSSQDQVFVMENMDSPIPDIVAIGATSITCETSEVVLDGSFSAPFGDLTFAWSTTNGNIITDPTAPQMEANQAGTYNLVVTNITNGCTEEMNFDIGIDVEDPVAAVAQAPILTCALESFNLNGSGSSTNGDFEYVWTSLPAGGILSGGTTLTPMIDQAGVFTLTVTNSANGCVSTTSITVGEDTESPEAAASVDEILDCITETVNLSGNGSSSGSDYIYLWTGSGLLNGETTLSPEVNAAGNYVLLVTNQVNGCTETAIVEVEENPDMPVDLDLDPTPPVCFGELGTLGVVSVTGGEGPYAYSLDGEFFLGDTVFAVPAGYTTVYVQDIVGCTYEEQIFVADVIPVGVALEADLTISLGEETQLHATTNIPEWLIDTIIWTPGDSLSCTDCLDPYANPTSSTTYTVTVINDKGCDDTAEIRLEVKKDRDVFIPNAFSPNGDGINDVFVVYSNGRSVKQINELHIYNRWGEEIFENSNFQPDDEVHGWNGTFREELMNPAVFVYWCEIEYEDGFVELFKGDVTIVK